MPEHTSLRLVFTNCPDREAAERIARALVDEGLAACVTVLGSATSVYRWEGSTQVEPEWPLMIKTTLEAWPALQPRLRALHPHDLPEIVAVPVTHALPAYEEWVRTETRR